MKASALGLLVNAREAAATGRGRAIREAAGLTQGELARAIGVTPGAVNRWEAGTRKPTGESALRYARILRVLREQVAKRAAA